ncbi:hypothetical protein [Variovorax paradoxus]|jgi:hypothetical protein|uniref:hypothetical protein n=1 Tax=Variovorax paradoxus TaxID=34073 RepID=UPI003D651958
MAKAAANREKDREFNMALLQHGLVRADTAIEMVDQMQRLCDADKKSMRARIRRWVKLLRARLRHFGRRLMVHAAPTLRSARTGGSNERR